MLIAQSEIVGEPNYHKNMRVNNAEVVTKEGSVLSSSQVHDSCWVVDEQHLYCYADEQVKVFSKNQSDLGPLEEGGRLLSTLVKSLPYSRPDCKVGRLYKNPGLAVCFDPASSLYFTLVAHHSWPSCVLVYKDVKGYAPWLADLCGSVQEAVAGQGLARFARRVAWKLAHFQKHRYHLKAGITSLRLSAEYIMRELQLLGENEKNPDVRKKLKLKRAKLYSRISKFKEPVFDEVLPEFLAKNEKFVIELKKDYFWCEPGSI